MKNIRLFSTAAARTSSLDTLECPNVSLIEGDMSIVYKPKVTITIIYKDSSNDSTVLTETYERNPGESYNYSNGSSTNTSSSLLSDDGYWMEYPSSTSTYLYYNYDSEIYKLSGTVPSHDLTIIINCTLTEHKGKSNPGGGGVVFG